MSRLAPLAALAAATLAVVACVSSTPPSLPDPAAAAGTPTPAPSPTPVNPRLACGVARGTGDGSEHSCPRQTSNFLPQVDAAINRVVAKHPELFDLDSLRGNGGYFVKNVDEYYRQVVQELGDTGLCALVDGGGEIAVKRNNDFNDQYHIMISAGFVRRGEVSYRATCYPAWF